MEDFQSKYSGEQVEEMLDQIANGEAGGGGGSITVETDPIFSASPAASITEEKKTEWDNKVDKVGGKQLSTEDFTSALRTKLEGLSNYDDTELSEAISTLRGDFDKLVSGDTTTAIKTFNEVIAFLDGIQDTKDLSSIIASIEQQIAGKQDKLVSGTNIKTINGQSLLGSGNITIEGGNGSTNGISMKVEYITPTNSSIAFAGTEQRPSMKANTIYVQQSGSNHTETLDELDIQSFEETTEAYAEYVIIFVFNSPLWGAMISLPSYVKWTNGTPPTVEPEVVYELNISRSILAGEATYCAVLTPFKPVE